MSDDESVRNNIRDVALMGVVDRLHKSADALLWSAYPELARIDDLVWKQAVGCAKKIHVVAGSIMLPDPAREKEFQLLMSGALRVFHAAPDGREVTLYRVKAGGLCVLSLYNLFNETSHSVITEAETDVTLMCINEKNFHAVMRESDAFRNYVLANISRRIVEILGMIQDTVFNTLGLRLACLLGCLFEREQALKLKITHQLLACELGTTREVISRILKEFERKGCIKLGRGWIQLASQEALTTFKQTI